MEDINIVVKEFKDLEEKDTLEIYKLKSQINSLIRETSNCKGENENLLNEIQSLVLSESSVFNKPSPFLEKENDLMAQMTLLFSDLDKALNEDLKDKSELLRLEQENSRLSIKKSQLECEFQEFKEKIQIIEDLFNENFNGIENENIERIELTKSLEKEIKQQNEEIEKFTQEKTRILEEYEAKLNLKNIRYELEMDDFLRNKKVYQTEMKPKTVTKGKFSEFRLKNDSKKKIKYE